MHPATGRLYRVPATDELLAQLPIISQSGAQLEAFLQKESPPVSVPVLDDAPPALLLRAST